MMKFKLIDSNKVETYLSKREGEKKIGETISLCSDFSVGALKKSEARFVVLGIPEDIGPRANCGRGGADSAWEAFLPKFLNIQETELIQGSNILLLGAFEFFDLKRESNLEELREQVAVIDEQVSKLIKNIIKADKIPIVIGGGHNNAYGLLKGCSKALGQSVNCLNLDPHADYRKLEGRHSGNGFSYAKAEGYLDKYSIVALHENYNSQEMINRMENDLVDYSTFEGIFLREEIEFEDAIGISLNYVHSNYFGVELDCDSIIDFPSSAQTPSGITSTQARKYIHMAASEGNAIYCHLPEAAPSLVKGSNEQSGKLLAYLVSDFIKAHRKLN